MCVFGNYYVQSQGKMCLSNGHQLHWVLLMREENTHIQQKKKKKRKKKPIILYCTSQSTWRAKHTLHSRWKVGNISWFCLPVDILMFSSLFLDSLLTGCRLQKGKFCILGKLLIGPFIQETLAKQNFVQLNFQCNSIYLYRSFSKAALQRIVPYKMCANGS